MEICNDNKSCTGCMSCANICKRNAITVINNELGEYIPEIDNDLCIGCKLCYKICPANSSNSKFFYPIECYALRTKNEEDLLSCASGGVSTTIAKNVIAESGVVYGTKYENCNLVFSMAKTLNELEDFKGSKYVQAYIGYVFRDIELEMETKKKVLFVGTPCQVDGLLHYLKGNSDNLLTIDFVCHGTPPMKYLKEYVRNIYENFSSISFRGYHDYKIAIWNNNKERVYIKDASEDLYFKAFLDGLINRESCYHCRYARPERCSDITIGDFWGIDRSNMKIKYNGKYH